MPPNKPGRPPAEQPIPAAERIRQFRARQGQSGLVRTEFSLPKNVRESVRSISDQLGMPYAQAASSLLEAGLAMYQANACTAPLESLKAALSSGSLSAVFVPPTPQPDTDQATAPSGPNPAERSPAEPDTTCKPSPERTNLS